MPPEPLPWDRKDFFKERKQERSSSENLVGGGGGSSRWRETPSYHRLGSAEFRRPPDFFFKERKQERSSSENLGGGGGSSRWRETPSNHRWGSADFRRPPDFFKERKQERSSSENLGGGGGSSRWRETPSHHPWVSAEFRRPPDFFKERKQEWSSSENLGGGGSSRWRETPSHHRWGSTEFRRPPGHGKQGGWHMFSEESFHGCGPSQSNGKILDDESCRPFGMMMIRDDGKYDRRSRENRGGPFSQRDWKGRSWDAVTASSNGPGRPLGDVNEKRSVDDMLTYNSHPHSDFVKNWDQFHFKDQHDKNGGVSALVTGQRFERENSLASIDWKPLKWTRSGSLSSRGSGLSHSSSSKSMGVDSSETKVEVHPRNVTPVQSPSGDAAACVTSAAPSEETSSRKKPRLGWGEGLAKYEKKKVEGPDDAAGQNGIIICGINTEPLHSHISNVADRSPRVTGSSDCASPATPSSVACSSSPGVEDKSFLKAVNVDTANLCGSPCPVSQNQSEGLAFNLETLEVTPIANLSSSLSELLQYDDPSSVDSGFVRSTAMNKLLVLKADISKALEITESEIDSLENELKSLISDTGNACPCPASSCSLLVVRNRKPTEEPCPESNLIPRSAPLQLHSSGDMIKEKILGALEGELDEGKDEDIDSPGTATSKFAKPLSLGRPVSPSDTLKHDECSGNLDISGTEDLEVKCSVYAVNEEITGVTFAKHIASSSSFMLSTDVGVHYDRENILSDLIVASNKDSAHRASEVFSKLLPTNQCRVDTSRVDCSTCSKNNQLVKERFVMRKRFLRFKERIITLKFRAFQYLWKEDLRLLSIRRSRAKSQKKFELNSRMVHSGYQKHRSSIHSRFSSPAGNLRLVPTTEIINFASKLLADSHVQIYRSALKMPALVLGKKEKMISRFISSNGLVEDPFAAEKERSMINHWTSEEKEIFLDKLSTFGKDFRKIASFLDHKTTADCVEFYYKNHKSDCFQKTKKKPEFAKQGKSYYTNTYLVTSGKRWNREKNAASLDMLAEASAIAANVDDGLKNQQKCASRFFGTSSEYKTPQGDDGMLERSSSLDIFGNERETVAVDVLAGICGSLSSEAMSSCITSSIDPGEGYQERKCQTVGSSMRRPLTPEVTQNVDNETCSDDSCGEMDPIDWTDEEKSIFIQSVSSYGKDFAMISRCVRTRSRDQCKVFFSKARKCLRLDMMRPGHGNEGTPTSDDAIGGESDTEDTCDVETGSVICSDKSGSMMDEELPLSNLKVNGDESDPARTINMHPYFNQLEENNRTGELDHKNTELRPESFVSADCRAEDRADLDFDGDSNIHSCVGSKPLAVQVLQNGIVTSDANAGQNEAIERGFLKESVIGRESNDNGKLSISAAVVEIKAEGEVYADYSRAVKAGHELLLPGSSLNDKWVEIGDANLSDVSVINSSIQGMRTVALSAGNASLAADTDSSAFGAHPGNENRNAVELDPAQKPHVDSLQQRNCYVTTNSVLQDPAALQHEKRLNHDVASTLDFEKTSHKQCQNSASTDAYHQHLCVHSLLDHVDPSQILRGYPVSVSTRKGTNGDIISCNKPTSLQSVSKVDGNFHSDHFSPQDCYLQKCNGSKHHDPVPKLHFLSQDQSKDHPRPQPRCSSDSDKSNRNGDVKLFGQILSHPSTQQKPNSRAQENEDRGAQHDKLSDKSFNLKFTGTRTVDGILASAKFDCNNYLGLENLPVRSCGFWDGNRMQTGFPSLPDSAILLTKYPAALSNYPTSSSKIEQQQLHSIGNNNDCSLNGVSVFPTGEINSSKGVADYQAYRSRDGNIVQPFTVDMKQRPDILFSEMQRRGSEFDAVSSIQQQARGMVGINVVGRGGILLGGGPCTGVSDPVAAIKMHYAKTEQYSGQTGSIMREEESWRGKGDIGR